MNYDWSQVSEVESKVTVTTALSETSSSTISTYEDGDDYFLRHNTITGFQSLVLMQFHYETVVLIIVGISLGYVTSTIDAALALGIHNEHIERGTATLREVLYAFDSFYFLDLISMIVYKQGTWEKRNTRHKPRHGFIIFIEFVSLVPWEAVYLTMIKDANAYAYYCLRLRYALRWCRICASYMQIKEFINTSSCFTQLLIYVNVIYILALSLGCISYVVECRMEKLNCEDPKRRQLLISQFIYYSAGHLFIVGKVEAIKNRITENIFASFIPYIILVYFLSNFIVNILHMSKKRFDHMVLFTWLNSKIATWKKENLREWRGYYLKYELLVDEFNNITWNKNEGCYTKDYFGKVLPPIMYKELALDISWLPLKHTHLFRHEDVFFLRAVSSIMQHTTYCPGEVIFKRNQFKNMMIYIKSGIVEILSEEDSETPIFSLTSGTCLGESTLTISYPSSCTVVAKGICDIAILNRKDFLRLSKTYPEKTTTVKRKIRDRYEEAINLRDMSLFQLEHEDCTEPIGIVTMKWIKLILRRLLFSQERFSDLRQKYFLKTLQQNIFCAKYLDFLVVAEDIQLVTDSVFLRNEFPYIFKPNSVLLKSWNVLVLVLSLAAAVSFPYYTVFLETIPLNFHFISNIVTILWIIDLYFKSSTAIEVENSYIINFVEIIYHNFADPFYAIDIISVVPMEHIVAAIEGSVPHSVRLIVFANRLLKLYRLELYFQQLNLNVYAHVFMHFARYCTYFGLIVYYLATILHMLGARSSNAAEFEKLLQNFAINSIGRKIFLCVSMSVFYISSMDIAAFPFIYDWESCTILLILLLVINVSLFLFISHTTSSNMLIQQHVHKKNEFLINLSVTMHCFNLTKQLSKRIKRYAKLQFQVHGVYFLQGAHILDTLPLDLAAMTYNIQIGDLIRNQPLFFDLDETILTHICHIASIHFLPAMETIKHTGEVCKEIHILCNGICTLTCFDGRKKKVYSGECFSLLESALNIPSMVTVKALTTCRILSLNFVKLNAIMLRYPVEYKILQETVRAFQCLEILAKVSSDYFISETEEIEEGKQPNIISFGYDLKKRTTKYFRYHEGFPKWLCGLKFLLLRYSFTNNGKFVFYWEISRSIFALLTNFILPFTVIHKDNFESYIFDQIMFCLDLTAYLDIYIRLHFTYFNQDGIEVSHPYYTAKHRLHHSLLIDLLACFPFHRILRFFTTLKLEIMFCLNRVLQLYRYIGLYRRIFGNKMRNKGVIEMLAVLPHIIIAHNYLTAFCFVAFCTVTKDSLTCDERTWMGYLITHDKLKAYRAYAVAFMYITAGTTANSFSNVKTNTFKDLALLSCITFASTILYLVLLGNIVATSLSINKDLNIYQEALNNLVKFLGYRKIDKAIKNEIVNHFEYMWNKTRGKSIHKSFQPFKSSFKVEALYNFYGTVFRKSSIFPEPNTSFFKSLLLEIKHEIYLKTGIIYSVNDVNGYVFLLFKGRVEVVGADFNKLVSLRVGSIFGNLDNCPMGRRTLSMIAYGHVEVLKFSSTVFHAHLKKFPSLRKHFMKLTIFNVDFLEEKRILCSTDRRPLFELGKPLRDKSENEGTSYKKVRHIHRRTYKVFSQNKVMEHWKNVFLNIIYFLDYFLHLYGISTRPPEFGYKILLYILDLLHICKMCMKFNTSFEDEFGQIVVARKDIARNYIKQKLGFYIDLACLVPIEVISPIFWHSTYFQLIWFICRSNRLVRIIFPLVYLRRQTQKLNINVLITNSLYLLTKIVLVIITLGFWVRLMYNEKLVTNSVLSQLDAYSKSMMVVSNSCWRFPFNIWYLLPTASNSLMAAIIVVIAKYLTMYFIAECCGTFYVTNYTRNSYGNFSSFIKRYMSDEKVSKPLVKRIKAYVELLWAYKHGDLFPDLLDEAPYYLKEAVLNSMFGFHLVLHPLLEHCHKDLTRQMASHMKTLVFFPGDVIVYVGDIDSCMYFIHEGEVHVLNEDTLHSERIETVLHTGEMFGLDQGLYERCGHEFTYKVVKYSVIISLHRDDWIYLLDFFPASKRIIYDKTVAISPDS